MSGNQLDTNYSNLNPAPQGPLIPPSANLQNLTLSSGFISGWPTLQFKYIIKKDIVIDFSLDIAFTFDHFPKCLTFKWLCA